MNVPTLQRPLAQGATTLVMRSTHLKLTNQEIMTLLNVLTVALGYKRPMYDFVYMPWAKLAIVNFVDHASYKAHFDKIQEVCDLGTEHPAIRNVAQAYIQGLAANLAFFLAKSGQQESKCRYRTLCSGMSLQNFWRQWSRVSLRTCMRWDFRTVGLEKEKAKAEDIGSRMVQSKPKLGNLRVALPTKTR
ncbi:unnamed protein product [Cladocopium goreaui]|uniref:Ubiquitin carboxyl-terminal hydrolase 19 n=1 Tax=Cladocopium goreaui TaxID=2562237 RepID=A0A9P1BN93_9DINO|nr:unnamed protein product [Cladocopium goreaui]